MASEVRPAPSRLVGGLQDIAEILLPTVVLLVALSVSDSVLHASTAALVILAVVAVTRLWRGRSIAGLVAAAGSVAAGLTVFALHGSPESAFLPGIFASLAFVVACATSLALRWPLAGVVVSFVAPEAYGGWRSDKARYRAFRDITLLLASASCVRAGTQAYFFFQERFWALGAARLALGLPLYALTAVLVWHRWKKVRICRE